MSRIEIIAASAGSGKTTRISRSLADGVKDGSVRPDSIVATTFTVKAAAELAQRVRAKLLGAGKAAEAHRLSAARIGTVNSVCERLVTDLAFSIGLSPELRVLDETTAETTFRKALAGVLTQEEQDELSELTERLGEEGFGWQEAVGKVVTLARYNMVSKSRLAESARRSESEFIKLFGAATSIPPSTLRGDLETALSAFESAVNPADGVQDTLAAKKRVENDYRRLVREQFLPWSEWGHLAKLKTGAKSRAAAEPIQAAAGFQDFHPQLHQDARRAIQLVFDLAARAMTAYDDLKKTMGAMDFTDQEVHALRLLDLDEVREFVSESLDLLLVDEFQDTSPLQLALFLKLAELAKRSVWVGDQKQSIYGFRGTDPALMDAAISVISASGTVETLGTSYRSRPGLVNLTSALFVPAFARKGIPEERVRLVPGLKTDPPGLGPFLEYWSLAATRQEDAAVALAVAAREFLEDKTAKVRDPGTGEVRAARPGDMAILCRKNDTCAAVARALADQGLKAALPRKGLMSTPEARLMMAGLRIWVDHRDTLAKAEVARLIEYAGSPDNWLKAALENPRNNYATLDGATGVKQILAASLDSGHLAALAVFDQVAGMLDMRGICHRWGDTAQRLSNLDALRALAVGYALSEGLQEEGRTPAGLVAHLAALGAAGEDSQGMAADTHSVVVSTWHTAKGLEWPVVVLFELADRDRFNISLGVHVVDDKTTIDLANPLEGRWIRYWPNPYAPGKTGLPFHDRLSARSETEAALAREDSEALRLLYVRWTRARDVLVIAAMKGKLKNSGLALLATEEHPLEEPKNGAVRWAGQEVTVKVREAAPEAARPKTLKAEDDYAASGPREHPPAHIRPSGAPVGGGVGDPARGAAATGSERSQSSTIGTRIQVRGSDGWDEIGNAVHAFLCADRDFLAAGERLALAKGVLERFDVAGRLSDTDLVQAGDDFRKWVNGKWPGAKWHREWPLFHRLDTGSVVHGSADLVLEIDGGFVLIDHKSYPGNEKEAVQRALGFTGQLTMYAQAITAAKEWKMRGACIHLPMLGMVVELGAGV